MDTKAIPADRGAAPGRGSGHAPTDALSPVLAACPGFRRVVEAGAGVGERTAALKLRFGRVEAFEPQRRYHEQRIEAATGAGVRFHRIALGDRARIGHIARTLARDGDPRAVLDVGTDKTGPVAVRTLDSYGWDDVDLIHVAAGRRFDEVLRGARETIARSLPLIWIEADPTRGNADAQAAVVGLDALGYGIGATDRAGRLLRPPRPPVSSVATAVRLSVEGERPVLAWRDIPQAEEEDRVEQGLLNRAMVAVRSRPVADGRGRALVTSVAVSPSLDIDAALTVRRADRPAFTTDLRPVVEQDLGALLDAALRCVSDAGGVRVAVPWQAAAVFDAVTVQLDLGDGEVRVLFRRRLRDIVDLDAIAVALPLALVTHQARRVEVVLSGADRAPVRRAFTLSPDPARFTADVVNGYRNRGGAGNPAVEAMTESIGARSFFAEDGYRPGVSLVWGVLRGSMDIIRSARAVDGVFYYMDHAYLGRGHGRNYRITRDRFEAGAVRACPPDRIEALRPDVRPWRSSGRYILVCPPTDYFVQAHGCAGWLDDTLAQLRSHTDREIVVRAKPAPGEAVPPLEEALAQAHALVTHSSNIAVEAVIAGVPVFVSAASAAAPVGAADLAAIETPSCPDRRDWLANLAYSQFSFDEMRSGEAWSLLRDYEGREIL